MALVCRSRMGTELGSFRPCDRDHADAKVEARLDVIEPAASPLAFDSGGVWTLRRSADELLFEFRSPRFGAVPYKTGRFRPDFSTGEVVLHRPYFPMARAIAGGLVFSTLVSLLVLPTIYSLLDDMSLTCKRLLREARARKVAAPANV